MICVVEVPSTGVAVGGEGGGSGVSVAITVELADGVVVADNTVEVGTASFPCTVQLVMNKSREWMRIVFWKDTA